MVSYFYITLTLLFIFMESTVVTGGEFQFIQLMPSTSGSHVSGLWVPRSQLILGFCVAQQVGGSM